MKMRAPAMPILNIDPYFSVWIEKSVLENPVHWTGKPNSMSGRVFVDGEEYHFFGLKTAAEASIEDMTVENTEIDAFSTAITYTNEKIRLTVRFTSPTLVTDLYYVSRPVAYCMTSYECTDGKEHEVKVRFCVGEEAVLNLKGEGKAVLKPVECDKVTAIAFGNEEQRVLNRSGDNVRIDWGYYYLAVKGKGKVSAAELDGMFAVSAEAELNNKALFLFAYDDIYSIEYFGEKLKAYWKKDGKTIEEALDEAAEDYFDITARCDEFSDSLKKRATQAANEKYAELLLLAYRQVMAAHKLVVDTNGELLYISKECFSNGCAATVDVTYPSAPMYLLYNTELLKAMLRPVMRFAESDGWKLDFSPHDVGRYPLVNGQNYSVKTNENGERVIDMKDQMPVEECGNMLILFAAISETENDISFAEKYIDTIQKWSRYLVKYGLDPENQLCTDDFAGHLAHNVNLSIKAVAGIAGYSLLLSRLGKKEEAEKMMNTAHEYAADIVKRAENADGSFRLAFDKPDTFSLKYNCVWDKLWKLNLFPDRFYSGELARMKKELLPYGVPLDSREKYTKSDWIIWTASLFADTEDFLMFSDTLWNAYNTTKDRVPMTDWYYSDTADLKGFRHRSVQGGLFIRLLF